MGSKVFGTNESTRTVLTGTAAAFALWVLLVFFHYFLPGVYGWLASEDKLGENLTALFYAICGVLVLWSMGLRLKRGETTFAHEIFPFLVGLFCIFVGGEEISWGQRLFHIATPETIAQNNVQGELTLHNMAWFDRHAGKLNQHTILNLIALSFGVLVPVGYALIGWARRLADFFNFPVMGLSCVGWFFFGLLHGQTVAKIDPHWAHTENKELVLSIGFLCFGIGYFRRTRAGRKLVG